MNIRHDVSLADYSTMHLGGTAKYLVEINNRAELREAYKWAIDQKLPCIMIGSGSNIVWRDSGFPGLVMVCKLLGFETYEADESSIYVTIGAGEIWDEAVRRCVAANLTGIEALSLVPGTAGATPVQNVGAYGQELEQVLATLEAYDTHVDNFITLRGSDCGFEYRSSRFKTTDRGRFFITAITLQLTKANPLPPFYGALQSYLDEHGITNYTPGVIRDAVIAIRSTKLPDPAVIHNTGSFFANPIISSGEYFQLSQRFDQIPHWPVDEKEEMIKLSAAWLIEQAGFKDVHDQATGMATWAKQPLVLVNEQAHSTTDLLTFKQKIVDTVRAKFNITLTQEPELLPDASP